MAHMPTTSQPEGVPAVPNTRSVNTGGGLQGGGPLSADRTIEIAPEGVTTDKIADNAVTMAKLEAASGASLVGAAAAGSPQYLTGSQATALLSTFSDVAKGLAPASGGGTSNFLRADGTWSVPPGDTTDYSLNVKDAAFGAVADWDPVAKTGTDNRNAFMSAIMAALATNKKLIVPPGNYRVSKYVLLDGVRDLVIQGSAFAAIYFDSDGGTATDSIATSNNQSCAAFLLRNCQNVTFDNLIFWGDDHPSLLTNTGPAIYAKSTRGLRVLNCTVRGGFSLLYQDAQLDATGTGDSIAVNSGIVTLTDAGASFHVGQVGRRIHINNATNPSNNGAFEIIDVLDSHTIAFANAGAVAETSSLTWRIEDGDRDTLIDGCRSYGARGILVPGPHTTITNSHFEQPLTMDLTGIPSRFLVSGTTVTLVDPRAPWDERVIGRYVKIASATSNGNDGVFRITGATKATRYAAGTLTYENASAVEELAPETCTWWIPGGEKVGRGAGVGALAKDGNTMTLTADEDAFSPDDVGKIIHVNNPTSIANYSVFVIEEYVSPTEIKYTNAGGVAEDYDGIWQIDGYDGAFLGSANYGSTHAIYCFAGREHITVDKCTFLGIRRTAIKASGSALPIRNIKITNNYARECGQFCALGADDVQEHTDLTIVGNHVIDCGTGRLGWNDQIAFDIQGSRDVIVAHNTLRYTHNCISIVDTTNSVDARYGISARRYSATSQPLENVTIVDNTIMAEALPTHFERVLDVAIRVSAAGLRGQSIASGTLTKSGNTMTLTATGIQLGQENVGDHLVLSNCPDSGNNGTFVITAVTGASTLQYENASGVGGGASIGFGRIRPNRQHPSINSHVGFGCKIARNMIVGCANTAITVLDSVQPEIVDNAIGGVPIMIRASGCAMPVIRGNTQLSAQSSTAPSIVITNTCSWPIVYDNYAATTGGSTAIGGRLRLGLDSSTAVDHPLLGKTGRARPTDGQPEMVLAWGSRHAPGDTVTVYDGSSEHVFTYVSGSPGANQFSNFAELVALIDGIAGIEAADYGDGLAGGNVDTQHLRIRAASAGDTDGLIYVKTDTMNRTALVVLANGVSSNQATCYSRGAGSSGPVADKIVVWSPLCRQTTVTTLAPDNADARAVFAGGPALPLKNADDSGCCEVLQTDTTTGTEEFRWAIH